jgi:hypothetical protein
LSTLGKYKWRAGWPDFSWNSLPKREKMDQINIKYTKWTQKIPNAHKTCQHVSFQDSQKFTHIGSFGSKMCYLATLVESPSYVLDWKLLHSISFSTLHQNMNEIEIASVAKPCQPIALA